MNLVKFLLTAAITATGIYFLNTSIATVEGTLPPLGKFLNPFHGFWQNAIEREGKTLPVDQLPGLRETVTVQYDAHLIPHVYANNNDDAFYMQGFLTARHRLWQMEFQTHAAAGRLTEIVGDKALGLDRDKRRMGLTIGAENAMAFLSKDSLSMRIINSYCAGINDYIRQLKRKDYPVEYKLLDYAPEAWKPVKTALLLTYMANILSSAEHDFENTNFVNTFGETLFQQLYRIFYKDQDPIIPGTHRWDRLPAANDTTSGAPVVSISQYNHHQPSPLIGSNNWAVNGQRSATGRPILSNDPHLRLSLPSIWFQMHLVTPDCNVYGVTFPGAPNIIIGFNEDIAWGVTNAGRDVRDWYQINFTNPQKSKYAHGAKELETSVRQEVYKIRGGEDFTESLYLTHHGPVVYDDQFPLDQTNINLALQWTAHHPASELLTFFYLNRAENHSDYLKALDLYHVPAQNFVFASKSGDIAIKQQGKFPLYQDQQGRFLKDGSDPSHDWSGYIPFDQNPSILNPERGFVSSANQHPTDSTYPYIYSGIFQFFRNKRLNHLLTENDRSSARDHMNWQLDNYNLQAAESMPSLLKHLDRTKLNPTEKEVLKLLKDWSFMNDQELEAPSYFQVWWEAFNALTWDEMLEADHVMAAPHKYATIQILKDHPNHPFFDRVSTPQTETVRDIVGLAFKEAVNQLHPSARGTQDKPTWWKVKSTEINHLARIPAFSRKNIRCGGNKGILNATGKYWGPSWRMVVALGDSIEAYGIYPGGQSGNPGSPFYDNFIDDWAEGKCYPIQFCGSPIKKNDHYLYTQEINPVDQ